MVYDVSKVSGIGEFTKKTEKERELFFVNEKVFLVLNKNTVEVRCDEKLGKFLREKYESVMESRYFGRGGIEIVMSGQLQENEVDDLVRLSYNLSKD
ncbi:MmcQ/YjbR family DNA-binding protein [Candidatus Saccharibacteria bacterium]|jgi:predicted DNA-binding protein (MmcQ/YjbR family)|nr:MmcQ/YjbR family DNA-binding protein [Candidatus Saccharibacteria bacterium]